MTSKTHIKVRGYHLDGYQHVNNARYLEFLEEARWAYFEENPLLQTCLQQNIGFVVVNINIDFKRAAKLNDDLEVQTTLQECGDKKGQFLQKIIIKDTQQVVAQALVTFVFIDLIQNKAIVIDSELKALLQSILVG